MKNFCLKNKNKTKLRSFLKFSDILKKQKGGARSVKEDKLKKGNTNSEAFKASICSSALSTQYRLNLEQDGLKMELTTMSIVLVSKHQLLYNLPNIYFQMNIQYNHLRMSNYSIRLYNDLTLETRLYE